MSSNSNWTNEELRNVEEEKKRDILLFKCFGQFAAEQHSHVTTIFHRLIVLSEHSNFRDKFNRIVSIPYAASEALKFIVHRVRNQRTAIRDLIAFEIAALNDYMKDKLNFSTLAPYVSSPSNVSSASSNSSNSLLEENETLKKRVKELESIAQEQSHRVVKTMDEFKVIVRDKRVEKLLVPKEIAKELNKFRNKCHEQKSTLDRIQELALAGSEYQINDNDSPEMKTLKESMNAQISNMDAAIHIQNETHKKQDEEIKSLRTKLKSLYEETAKHKKNMKSVIDDYNAQISTTKSNLESQVKQLKEGFEAVTKELKFEKMENEEHLGAIETLLVEDRPDAPSNGKKRTHDHIEKSSQSYLKECKDSLQSQAIEDIDLSPEMRKEKCTEDLAGHKVPTRMKQLYEHMGEKYSFTKEMSQLPEAIGEALETYINEGVITFPAIGKLSSKKTVIDRLSFPDQNESDESKTTQQVLDFLGGKLQNIPNMLRLPDTQERLTVIISDQEPIEYPHNYVTKINKNRPKINEEDQKILDGLLKRRNYLAEVAERTQMKMIQLTIDKLGLEVLAEVDQRSGQHKERLGIEDLINFEGESNLRLKMDHPTRMKHDRGLHVPVEEPLKVSVRLLDAAGMLPDAITWKSVYERLLLCLDSEFQSEDFNVDHYRFTAHSIIEFCSMTYFSQPQKDEAKRRISLAQKRRWELLSPEARQEIKGRISNALQGREFSPEHKLALSNALQGHEKSPEHTLAMSNAQKGRELSPEHILAMSKANAKYHYRVTRLDTEKILLEDCTRMELANSDFGVNYNKTNKVQWLNRLQSMFAAANITTGSIILNVSGVDYRIEKYLRNR